MIVQVVRFNIYLLCVALLAGAVGCRSPEGRRAKQLATLRVHLEVTQDPAGMSEPVTVCRASPVLLNVLRDPILTEAYVAEARVIPDSLGGFALQVQFNRQGTILLEQYTATNPGRRLAVRADFGEKLAEHRWLAAPLIARRIPNGLLFFTPDATRDETEQIARGLNQVAIQNGNQEKPKKSKAIVK
jgi:hypothetical protein